MPWQNDNKVCFLRMEGQMFGGVPMNLELRLSVEDSPNSAGVAIDMIRCAAIAKDRGIAGVIDPASAYFCKHPRTRPAYSGRCPGNQGHFSFKQVSHPIQAIPAFNASGPKITGKDSPFSTVTVSASM